MRYLHPVQAHERFVSSGSYSFLKDGRRLAKSEAWAIHEHPDGERFLRIDLDARAEEGKSILAEALQNRDQTLARLDIRYENARVEGGAQTLRATFQVMERRLQVGYQRCGAEREYCEINLPTHTLIDIPLLIFRGRAIEAMARHQAGALPIFVPMFERARLFPGTTQTITPPVEYAGVDVIALGKRVLPTRRYRYKSKALSYWIDEHGVIIRRVNAYRQSELVVEISNYAPPSK